MDEVIKVLLVDDEATFIEPIAFWLKEKGYNVSMAVSGKEAIEAVKNNMPDIVFLDIRMSGVDGLEVLKILKAFNNDLPVIMLTAESGDKDKVIKAKALGAAGYFTKSYTLEALLHVMQGALKTHKKLPRASHNDSQE